MTENKLSEKEMQEIKEEAEKLYPLFNINECTGPIDMQKKNGIVFLVRETYAAALTRERERVKGLEEALEECKSYFDDRADADHNGENFVPNDEMKMLEYINQTLNNYKNNK